jgi:hypothetical protein
MTCGIEKQQQAKCLKIAADSVQEQHGQTTGRRTTSICSAALP